MLTINIEEHKHTIVLVIPSVFPSALSQTEVNTLRRKVNFRRTASVSALYYQKIILVDCVCCACVNIAAMDESGQLN